tara:strand:+ start:569 stop:1096 length:528 start_codon:yes stop_codon:yes gene_type:complete
MSERPEEQQNWQNRCYDSFGPHFRIDTGNPQMAYNGTVVYDLLGSGAAGNTSSVGMMHGGLYHIYNDQCIEIVGGQKVDGGGVCVNIIGSNGDVTITALSSGDVRVTGRNIILDADKNVEIKAGGDFRVNASNSVNMSSNTCYIKAPYGKIRVREVGWMGGVFAGTSVSENVWSK